MVPKRVGDTYVSEVFRCILNKRPVSSIAGLNFTVRLNIKEHILVHLEASAALPDATAVAPPALVISRPPGPGEALRGSTLKQPHGDTFSIFLRAPW